jgi:hypothetical protein
MIFGHPETFAVEIYHEPRSSESKGLGRMCLRLQGLVLGKPDEEDCSLFHAVERITEVSASLGTQWDERFAGHSAEEVFAWIDAVLYTGEIDGPENELWKFDFLTNTGEQFDNFKSFVYCAPSGEVYIPFYGPDGVVRTPRCTAEEFRRVALELEQWFKSETAA